LDLKQIGIVGAGTMGSGIAQVCAVAKFKVALVDVETAQLDRARQGIHDSLNRFARKDKLSESIESITDRITYSQDLSSCADADVAVEAVYENVDVKADTIQKLSRVVSETAVIGSNTSAISITALAAAAANPARVIGIHFFNPVPMLKAVEVVRGLETDDVTMDTTMAFIRSLGKQPIAVARDIPGFLLNRINLPSNLEAIRMVNRGLRVSRMWT